MSSEAINRFPDLPPVHGVDADCSQVMTHEVQEMCENLKKRHFETAVIILEKGSGKVSTCGSTVGLAFFLSKPDLATMFQDFCELYSIGRKSIDTDLLCETSCNKSRVCDIRSDSEKLEDVGCKDYSVTKTLDNETESDGVPLSSRELSDQEPRINNGKHSEDPSVGSKRITRQKKEINTYMSVAAKGRRKTRRSTNLEIKTYPHKLQDSSLSQTELVESLKQHEGVEVKPAFECSECYKCFKSQAGLTAHGCYVHLKAKNGSEFSMPEYTSRNLQLQYIDKDGNETSGSRSSMYEKQVTDEAIKFHCKICSYSTEKYNVMIEHTQKHVIGDILACSLCQKTFQAKKSLWRHTNQHKKFPHMCKICLRMYGSKQSLKEHQITHKPSHMCSICSRTYDSVGRLNYHIKTSHGPKQNTCEICGSSFTNTSLLRQHKKRHGPKQFFCDKCSCSYYFMHQLTNHLKIHDKNSFKYKCNVCTKEYVNKSHWKEHLKLHDGSNFVQCDECGKSYNSKKSLNLHKNCKHMDERRFICQVCGKAFMTKHHLKNHLISHDDKRDYKCRFCDASFKKNDVLKMHENVHTREQKFMCDICGEHFLRRSSLRNHRLTHFPGHQRWKCRYCEEKFRTQSAMLTHIKNTHADIDLYHDRPFCKRCEQCGKVFAKGLTFSIHMDMHAGIKRHKCQICGNAFTDPANLRVHLKIHDGSTKKYICENCDSRFSSIKQYTSHMLKHGKCEKQVVQQSDRNTGLNLTVMHIKPGEESEKVHDTVLSPTACEETNHVDAAVTVSALETINLSQKQVNTNQRQANTCHGLSSCPEVTNTNTCHGLSSCPEVTNTNSCHGLSSCPEVTNTNTCHGLSSCPEVTNTNTGMISSSHGMVIADLNDAQLRPNTAFCSNTLNESVGGSLRQGIDIKNSEHIQLYYSAMF